MDYQIEVTYPQFDDRDGFCGTCTELEAHAETFEEALAKACEFHAEYGWDALYITILRRGCPIAEPRDDDEMDMSGHVETDGLPF